jgi:cytochrome c oxidase subunit 1
MASDNASHEDPAIEEGASEDAYPTPEPNELERALAGIAGGIVGTMLMTGVLFLVNATLTPGIDVFGTLAELAGVGNAPALGIALFFGAGMFAWPLLFVTLGAYLPGATKPRQGIVFAAVLWTGFITAFYSRYAGVDLVVFVVFSIVTHLAYGWVLGFVSARLTGQYEAADVAV